MFRCNECGAIFDKPKIVEEYRGECRGRDSYEQMAYCPECGDSDFEEYYEDDEEEEDLED